MTDLPLADADANTDSGFSSKLPRALVLLLPALLGLLLFSSTWSAGFVYDDIELLAANPRLDNWSTALETFGEPFWTLVPTFSESHVGYYRPVPGALFVVLHKLGGGDAQIFHVVNTLVHALSSLLVAGLALSIFRSRAGALAAGLAFALAGSHVEAVAWASALPDLLATCLSLGALWAWVRGRLVLATLLLLAAMLSKESAYATWLLLIGVTVLRSSSPRLQLPRASLAFLALFGVGILVYALRWQAFGNSAAGFDLQPTHHGLNNATQLAISFGLVARYLGFLVLPLESRPFRPLRLDVGATDAELVVPAVAGILCLVVAAGLWLRYGRRSPAILIGLGILFAGLVPVLNTTTIGRFPFEERFAYLSSVGVSLLIGALLEARSSRLGPPPLRWLGIAVIFAAAHLPTTLRITPKWAQNESFALWTTQVSPETMTPWLLAGNAILQRAQTMPQGSQQRQVAADQAFDLYQKSLEINVNEVLVASYEREMGNVGLGDSLFVAGDFKTAESVYRETLRGYPTSQPANIGLARSLLSKADVAYNQLGFAQTADEQNRLIADLTAFANEALRYCQQGVVGHRRSAAGHHYASVAHYWLARFYDESAWTQAEREAAMARQLEPANTEFFLHQVELMYLQGKPVEFKRLLEEFLRDHPSTPIRKDIEDMLQALESEARQPGSRG